MHTRPLYQMLMDYLSASRAVTFRRRLRGPAPLAPILLGPWLHVQGLNGAKQLSR